MISLWEIFGIALLSWVAFLCWYLNSNFNYWKQRRVPNPPTTMFIGNAKDSLLRTKNAAEMSRDAYDAFPGHRFSGTFLFRIPMLIVRDPDLIRTMLVRDFASFHHRGGGSGMTDRDPLSHHLLNLRGYPWRALRTRLTPTFTTVRMKAMLPLMHQAATCMASSMPRGTVELKTTCRRYTVDVIAACAFGLSISPSDQGETKFHLMAESIFKTTFLSNMKTILAMMAPSLANLLGLKLVEPEIEDFFMKVVRETVNYRRQNGVKASDFLNLLMEIQEKGKIEETLDEQEVSQQFESGVKDVDTDYHSGSFELTENLMAAQCFVFFIAGFDTSSTLVSFCLHELAVNTEIQDRLRSEVDTVLAKHNGRVTHEALSEMDYLDCVVNETLRKHPPVSVVVREVVKTYKIPDSDVVLEKGLRLLFPINGLHYDPKYFPNPETFDPERFSKDERNKRHPYAFLPFGEGPRNCIGMRFALQQSKVGLVALLSNFEFSRCEKTSMPIKLDPAHHGLVALGGNWVRVLERSKV